MPYVVTQPCCSDASCVYACPVNCIHPTPDEPDFGTAEMLHIDPAACVECGACVSACPVDAIVPHQKLRPEQQLYRTINADFYRAPREHPLLAPVIPAPVVRPRREALRVAIVGSGPAAMYAADELLTQPGVQVTVLDRLPTPYGLVRAGVAPDHQQTKRVTALFDTIAAQPGFDYLLNVEVGRHVTHDELLEHHHAVIYAVGAATDRRLGIAGESLPGCASATDFVAWYNGHPDHADDAFDLSHRRAVIVGNGNVALDVARVLLTDPERLAGTDIAGHALETLRASHVEEVVILGRRGAAQSAFTVPEFAGLLDAPGIEVVVEGGVDAALDAASARAERADTLPHAVAQKLRLLRGLPEPRPSHRRLVLRYRTAPTRVLGHDRVAGVQLAPTELTLEADGRVGARAGQAREVLETGLVLTSIGYHGRPVPGLPFDDATGTVPHDAGRVRTDRPGAYVAGWIKRGPTGYIGTNKSCAQETVRSLVADFNDGRLAAPTAGPGDLRRRLRARRPDLVDADGWRAIDRAERERGARTGRVREKITDVAELARVGGTVSRRRR